MCDGSLANDQLYAPRMPKIKGFSNCNENIDKNMN